MLTLTTRFTTGSRLPILSEIGTTSVNPTLNQTNNNNNNNSRETMESCTAEFSSVSASSGVAEEADARVEFSVALSAGEGGRRSVSVKLCLPA